MENTVFILSGVRTPIGGCNGCFEDTPVSVLGAVAIQGAIDKAGICKTDVDQVIMGQVVVTADPVENEFQRSASLCDLSVVPTKTNMRFGSGLCAVQMGYASIACGSANVVVCGGQESISKASAYIKKQKLKNIVLKDTIGCPIATFSRLEHVGKAAQRLAQKYKVSRQRQDKYAARSQNRAERAIRLGFFGEEIVGYKVSRSKAAIVQDERPRFGTTVKGLSQLKPLTIRDNSPCPGSVTLGNSAGIGDGAASLLLCSNIYLRKQHLFPLAKIVGFGISSSKNCANMELGQTQAIKTLLEKVGWSKDDVDLYEIDETAAVEVEIIREQLGIDSKKLNISGGAIALGHPLGASGARVLVTLLHSLLRLSKYKGVAAACVDVGKGMGIAIAIEITPPGSY